MRPVSITHCSQHWSVKKKENMRIYNEGMKPNDETQNEYSSEKYVEEILIMNGAIQFIKYLI